MLPETLSMECPLCKRKQPKAPLMRCGTLILRRTCPGCKTLFQIKIVPVRVRNEGDGMAIHTLDWLVLRQWKPVARQPKVTL